MIAALDAAHSPAFISLGIAETGMPAWNSHRLHLASLKSYEGSDAWTNFAAVGGRHLTHLHFLYPSAPISVDTLGLAHLTALRCLELRDVRA